MMSDLAGNNNLPNKFSTSKPTLSFSDKTILRLAREIAMDMLPLNTVLENHKITQVEWTAIRNTPLFQQYLGQFVSEWNSATNTPERVKLKSLAFVEEALPEFFARAHDSNETLNSKVEVLKTIAKFAGIGGNAAHDVIGEKFSVTINLGSDQQLRIEKDITPRDLNPKEGYQGDQDDRL